MTREDGRDGSRADNGQQRGQEPSEEGIPGGYPTDFTPVVTESFLPLARGPP